MKVYGDDKGGDNKSGANSCKSDGQSNCIAFFFPVSYLRESRQSSSFARKILTMNKLATPSSPGKSWAAALKSSIASIKGLMSTTPVRSQLISSLSALKASSFLVRAAAGILPTSVVPEDEGRMVINSRTVKDAEDEADEDEARAVQQTDRPTDKAKKKQVSYCFKCQMILLSSTTFFRLVFDRY